MFDINNYLIPELISDNTCKTGSMPTSLRLTSNDKRSVNF